MPLQSKNIIACLLTLWFLGCPFGVSAQTVAKSQQSSFKKVKPKSAGESLATVEEIKRTIIELDRKYQEAVKNNDAETMAQILADDFILVTGKGRVVTRDELLKQAREGKTIYERQEDSGQTVRVWGDTAVITALLWAKGESGGKSFDYKLWFSDVYKRTPNGWRYVFAQAAQPLPKEP